MTVKRWIAVLAATLVLIAPATALARTAYVTADLHLRAGPGTDYPIVTTIPNNDAVNVHGCVSGHSWCDVSWQGNRGFVSSNYLTVPHNGTRVVVANNWANVALPIIGFTLGSYWGSHYHNRPWYAERYRYEHRHRYRGPVAVHHRRRHAGSYARRHETITHRYTSHGAFEHRHNTTVHRHTTANRHTAAHRHTAGHRHATVHRHTAVHRPAARHRAMAGHRHATTARHRGNGIAGLQSHHRHAAGTGARHSPAGHLTHAGGARHGAAGHHGGAHGHRLKPARH